MRCPRCKNKLLQKSGVVTRIRIKGALEFDADGNARAQCFWCKARVDIPVRLVAQDTGVDVENFTIKDKGADG